MRIYDIVVIGGGSGGLNEEPASKQVLNKFMSEYLSLLRKSRHNSSSRGAR